MLTLNSPQVVQETLSKWKTENRIALVPTMGALHEGHLHLIRLARTLAEKVVVSIFVNPLQFGPKEDFSRYPRTFEEDREKCSQEKVDLLFAPTAEELYPSSFSTKISVSRLSEHLCGKSRPGHFEGVSTICLKLFNITQADFAVFGEKDFQQLRIIEQLAADMNLKLLVVRHPTVRESDGLAMSSRNRLLSETERKIAAKFPEALEGAVRTAMVRREIPVGELLTSVREKLRSAGIEEDYTAICSVDSLAPSETDKKIFEIEKPRIFAAVRIGQTRLIDNMSLERVT